MFGDIYRGKKVLITGVTGFKGSWLALWLTQLGAEVYGFAVDIPTQPSLFEILNLREKITYREGDIRDLNSVKDLLEAASPDFIFHLAAQSITLRSLEEPVYTFHTNALGTVNLLEAARQRDRPCTIVLITSDKCYENKEWQRGYAEDDRLGGTDPYSASKAMAEIAARAYYKSFFASGSPVVMATVRAGNIIGGGDWSERRLIPDLYRAWSDGKTVEIRHPDATRPWNFVLESLRGYLLLGSRLAKDSTLSGESFNFGPTMGDKRSVIEVVRSLATMWGPDAKVNVVSPHGNTAEHINLQLNVDKARRVLNWQPVLTYTEAEELVSEWYTAFYNNTGDLETISLDQIQRYSERMMQLT